MTWLCNTQLCNIGRVFVKKTLADDYEWLTFAEVDARMDAVSRGLLAIGVKPRDKVSVLR